MKYLKLLITGLLMLFLCFVPVSAKENPSNKNIGSAYRLSKYSGGLDVSFLSINSHNAFFVTEKLAFGFELNLANNFAKYHLFNNQDHFRNGFTDMNTTGYFDMFGVGFFLRTCFNKQHYIDTGVSTSLFLHSGYDDNNIGSGQFSGFYLKYFIPFGIEETSEKLRRRMSLGVHLAYGTVNEGNAGFSDLNFFAALWLRFSFNRKKNP